MERHNSESSNLRRPGAASIARKFKSRARNQGSSARQKGPRWGTGGEATELGPPDVERQESPLDRVPDQLGLIAQAKLPHQVGPMTLDRAHTDG